MTFSINNSLQHNRSVVVNFAPTALSDQRRFGFQPTETIEACGCKILFLDYSISWEWNWWKLLIFRWETMVVGPAQTSNFTWNELNCNLSQSKRVNISRTFAQKSILIRTYLDRPTRSVRLPHTDRRWRVDQSKLSRINSAEAGEV